MDVLTDQIVVDEVTLTDGGSTWSLSGDWYVEIPSGALAGHADGIVARDVTTSPQSPSHQIHLNTVGGAVSIFMMSSVDSVYYFNPGYYAIVKAYYDDADIPEGIEEDMLSLGYWWYPGYSWAHEQGEWGFEGLREIDRDTENNILTFHANYFQLARWWVPASECDDGMS